MINREQRLRGHLAKPQYDNHTASDGNVFKPAKKHLPKKKKSVRKHQMIRLVVAYLSILKNADNPKSAMGPPVLGL